MRPMTGMNLLSGIRIVDMTTVIFGPYATATLAGMGADVVKIEPPGGDEVRRVGRPVRTRGMGPCHMTINRGKRSVVWDLKSAAGQEALRRLLGTADVFIHNLRPDAIMRLDLDYARIRALRKDILYVHCTGFGSDGPYAGQAAYDDVIQAAAGIASLLPRTDGRPEPRFLPTALADKVSGLHAVYAVLGALFHRERTGAGQRIEVPMFEAVAHFMLVEHLYGATFRPPNAPPGYPRQLDPLRQPMRTSDGYITVAPYTDARWQHFFECTGHAGFLPENGLTTARRRDAGNDLMHAKMAAILATRSTAYWLEFLRREDIPAFAITDLADVIDDPHLRAVGFFGEEDHPTEGPYRYPKLPVRFGCGLPDTLRPAPLLGEHSDEVLDQLGLGAP